MVHLRSALALTLVPALLWGAGTALAQESHGPTVVVEALDDPDVRAALAFPSGWRLEAADGLLSAASSDDRPLITCHCYRRRDLFLMMVRHPAPATISPRFSFP